MREHPVVVLVVAIAVLAGGSAVAASWLRGGADGAGGTRVAVRPVRTAPDPRAGEFLVPLDAPLEDLPPGGPGGCSAEQVSWLRAHGRERVRRVDVEVRNTSGAAVSLTGVRARGTTPGEAEPAVQLVCPDPAGGDAATVAVDTGSAEPATVVTEAGAWRPFTVGLPAGAVHRLRLDLSGGQGFAGELVADVGGTEHVLAAGLERPGAGRSAALTVEPGAGEPGGQAFVCSEDSEAGDCSPAYVRAAVARLWDRPELAATAFRCRDAAADRAALADVRRGLRAAPDDPRPARALRDRCGAAHAAAGG